MSNALGAAPEAQALLQTPALVLGAGANGLGVARSLWRARVPVWLLDNDLRKPEMRTRAARPLAVSALHGEALVADLIRLGTAQFSGQHPVLLLTQEESVRTVSRHREQLSPLYRFSLPADDVVEVLQHKHGFQQLAERFDAPIPKLVHVRAAADLSALDTLRYPVAVKPGERHADYSRQFKKAYRVESAAEAVDLVNRILPVCADVVVQEWIEGPDSNIYFCLQAIDRAGRAVASFTGRKIRSWPPQIGGTASCTVAPEADAELSQLTETFFRQAGVVGLASMEFKRDSNSGEFRMVEPTIGRTDYQEEVATLNGVNLPFAMYCGELGLPFPAPAPSPRLAVWRVESEDVRSAALQQQRVGAGFPEGSLVLDAVRRGYDPGPWLTQTWRRIRGAVRARILKLFHFRPMRIQS